MAAQFSQTTRSLASDTSHFAHLAWASGGVLVIGWMLWFFLGSVTVYEISKQARLEVRQASHHIAALIPSKVVSTALAIGKQVQAGDVLVELDSSVEQLRRKEEEARLGAIPGQIAALQREIEARERARADDLSGALAAVDAARSRSREADAAVEFARDTERRLAQLISRGSATAVEAMRAATETLKLSASRDALLADLRRIESDAQTRANQYSAQIESVRRTIASLQGDMATIRATIARLDMEIEKHRVRAPISGAVGDAVPLHSGAYVAEGQRLATIVPAGDLIIAAEFSPSLSLGRVQHGQKGRLRLDGFPWAQFGTVSGTVSRVASEVRDNLVRVEFTLDEAPVNAAVMQHGLPGSVEVSVEQVSPATLVLRAAGLLLSTATPTRLSQNARERTL